jgi:hypothetical protein
LETAAPCPLKAFLRGNYSLGGFIHTHSRIFAAIRVEIEGMSYFTRMAADERE